jgi:hypothetical protein
MGVSPYPCADGFSVYFIGFTYFLVMILFLCATLRLAQWCRHSLLEKQHYDPADFLPCIALYFHFIIFLILFSYQLIIMKIFLLVSLSYFYWCFAMGGPVLSIALDLALVSPL